MSIEFIEKNLLKSLGEYETLIKHMKAMIDDLEVEVATLKAKSSISTQPREER